MFKKLLSAAVGLAFAGSAGAVFIPPAGPLFVKFNNVEQISPGNNIKTFDLTGEGNWGVFLVTTIEQGGTGQDFLPVGFPVFSSTPTGQISGIFYGTKVVAPGCAGCLDSAGGFIDLYWQDTTAPLGTVASLTQLPTDRSVGTGGGNAFLNFTDGTFLVRFAYASGVDPIVPGIHIRGNAVPSGSGFAGFADSFANVVDVDGSGIIGDSAADGAWSSLLNGDFFNTVYGQRDIKLRSIYSGPLATWTQPGFTGTSPNDIIGANSTDPIRAFAVPEPGTVALIGLSLLGLAGLRRRKSA